MTINLEENGRAGTARLDGPQLYTILLEEFASSVKRPVDEIDLDKTFDEYGLDSIDGVLMTGTIGERLNIDLPPEFLMQYRKVGDAFSAIAMLVGVENSTQETARALPQVYLFAGGAGRDGRLATLAQRCTGTIDGIFVLPGNWQEWVAAGGKLEAIIDACCNRIAMLSPQGSLRLAGYSQGGQLAFASAAELIKRGRHVDLLVLIDSPVKGRSWRASKSSFITENLSVFLSVLGRIINQRRTLSRNNHYLGNYEDLGEAKISQLSEIMRFVVNKNKIIKIQEFLNDKLSKRDVIHFDNYLQMQYFDMAWEDWIMLYHETLPITTRVWLLRSEDEGGNDLGWSKLCENLNIHQARGTHRSMFDDANILDLVKVIDMIVKTL